MKALVFKFSCLSLAPCRVKPSLFPDLFPTTDKDSHVSLIKKKILPHPFSSLVTVISYSTFFSHPRSLNTSLYALPPCPLFPLHGGFPGSWCPQSHSGNRSDKADNRLLKCCSQRICVSVIILQVLESHR